MDDMSYFLSRCYPEYLPQANEGHRSSKLLLLHCPLASNQTSTLVLHPHIPKEAERTPFLLTSLPRCGSDSGQEGRGKTA